MTAAFQTGLVRLEQVEELRDYQHQRRRLLDDPNHIAENLPLDFLVGQADWVIRAALLCHDLSARDRDYLEKRLLATLESEFLSEYATLEEALVITRLLDLIGRPIDRDKYRGKIHELLRQLHGTDWHWFQVRGGFKRFASVWGGDFSTTVHAIELMEIYGVPNGLDLNWVRSFLRPSYLRLTDQEMIAAVARERLNRLPNVPQPTWLDYLYYERCLVMALLLVLLCLYAAYSSPRQAIAMPTSVSSPENAGEGAGASV